jgi:uncharacterized RDD family membrane protein YckC
VALSKTQKVIVLISASWVTICTLVGAGIASDGGEDHFKVVVFLAISIILSIPVLFYWAGVWIWGFGFIKRLFAKIWKFGVSTDGDMQPLPVRPWLRYWARYIDINIVSLALLYFIYYLAPIPTSANGLASYLNVISSQLFWFASVLIISILLETVLISKLGATPGKMLLNILVVSNTGDRPSTKGALFRSFKVWFRGLALGIPLISFFTLAHQHTKLTKDKITSWDSEGGYRVLHGRVGLFRDLAAIAFIIFSSAMFVNFKTNSSQSSAIIDSLLIDKRLEETGKDYRVKSSALTKDILDSHGLDDYAELQNRLRRSLEVQSLPSKYRKVVANTLTSFESSVKGSDVLPLYKKILLQHRLASYNAQAQYFYKYFDLEDQANDEVYKTLAFLSKIFGTYQIKEKILFSNDDDVKFYNNEIKKLQDINAQETELLSANENNSSDSKN